MLESHNQILSSVSGGIHWFLALYIRLSLSCPLGFPPSLPRRHPRGAGEGPKSPPPNSPPPPPSSLPAAKGHGRRRRRRGLLVPHAWGLARTRSRGRGAALGVRRGGAAAPRSRLAMVAWRRAADGMVVVRAGVASAAVFLAAHRCRVRRRGFAADLVAGGLSPWSLVGDGAAAEVVSCSLPVGPSRLGGDALLGRVPLVASLGSGGDSSATLPLRPLAAAGASRCPGPSTRGRNSVSGGELERTRRRSCPWAGRRSWRWELCVGRGRAARLGCGQATMAAWAAWLRVLTDRGGERGEAPGYITYLVCVLVDGDGVHGRRVLLADSVVVLLPLPSYSG
ncbi:uncharacterized protein [Triticum aestivum]|uniref:uncharacterized protein n=1 Tax=Triticum aestivum TaxID=4565 RepID=UPI001D016838|nr:uncharacterized protein LOC123070497 [Triticum aestivum]